MPTNLTHIIIISLIYSSHITLLENIFTLLQKIYMGSYVRVSISIKKSPQVFKL